MNFHSRLHPGSAAIDSSACNTRDRDRESAARIVYALPCRQEYSTAAAHIRARAEASWSGARDTHVHLPDWRAAAAARTAPTFLFVAPRRATPRELNRSRAIEVLLQLLTPNQPRQKSVWRLGRRRAAAAAAWRACALKASCGLSVPCSARGGCVQPLSAVQHPPHKCRHRASSQDTHSTTTASACHRSADITSLARLDVLPTSMVLRLRTRID